MSKCFYSMSNPPNALPYLRSFNFREMVNFGLKTVQDRTCLIPTRLVRCIPDWTSLAWTCLVNFSFVSKIHSLLDFLLPLVHPMWLISTLCLLFPECTLVVRRGPSNDKMLSSPPSGVAQARRLCLVGLLLLTHVTTPITPVTRRRMSVSSMRGMHPKSAMIIMPSGTPRRPSMAPSTTTTKLLRMKAVSSPRTLSFGLFSTPFGTAPFTFTRRLLWCPLRK
jgi:hypothetical protein